MHCWGQLGPNFIEKLEWWLACPSEIEMMALQADWVESPCLSACCILEHVVLKWGKVIQSAACIIYCTGSWKATGDDRPQAPGVRQKSSCENSAKSDLCIIFWKGLIARRFALCAQFPIVRRSLTDSCSWWCQLPFSSRSTTGWTGAREDLMDMFIVHTTEEIDALIGKQNWPLS